MRPGTIAANDQFSFLKTGCATDPHRLSPESRFVKRAPCRTYLPFSSAFRLSPKSVHPPSRALPHEGNQTTGPEVQNSHRTHRVRRRARGRERQHHAQAGADVRDPEAIGVARGRDHRRRRRRGAAGRLRLPALRRFELSVGSRRHLRVAEPDPEIRPAHRRHRRRPDPRPEGRRALLRAAQGQHDQFRRPRKDPPQGPLRQPDAALSRPSASSSRSKIRRARITRRASSTSCRRSAKASAR